MKECNLQVDVDGFTKVLPEKFAILNKNVSISLSNKSERSVKRPST